MAPIPRSSASAATSTATQTLTNSQESRLLVRETLRIIANLASSPSPQKLVVSEKESSSNYVVVEDEFVNSSLRVICREQINGRRWKYVAETDGSSGRFKKASLRSFSLETTPQDPFVEMMSFVRSYVVPEGFPDSVTPSYVPYMTWRALKHFFGGAMGVFTTQSLLSSVGVSRNTAASGAVAINWILKDGAGRVGKMLFARQGKKFDNDLKQLRFAGDLLMELGAGIELATAAVPHLFLPLACAANVAKNVAAVTSTSTRTPIYKAFAKGENIGDVTAKGECVGNIADLVKSVVLRTLNRTRFSVAVESFLKTGHVPSLQEGNLKENVFTLPWIKDKPILLGSRFKDAFQEPASYLALVPLFEVHSHIQSSKGNVCALLKDQAESDDILKAAFHAHVLLHFIRSSSEQSSAKHAASESTNFLGHFSTQHPLPTTFDLDQIAESCKVVSASYGLFKRKAAEQGWMMSESLLYPGKARLY
ncbi:hypothetical protein MKW92_036295 [Papaver armeniacum]|nr:hypothetical protein MKW92_036295 [Papaver armeniacum]